MSYRPLSDDKLDWICTGKPDLDNFWDTLIEQAYRANRLASAVSAYLDKGFEHEDCPLIDLGEALDAYLGKPAEGETR